VTIVVDTAVLIDHLRGDPRARAVLARALKRRQRPAASLLTRAEVLGGVRPGEEGATYQLLSIFVWLAVDEQITERAGEMARQFLRAYPGIDLVDVVVAATAERLEAEIWTRNLKHFPMVERVLDPYGE
jgi:predicted nucleic acid-binding protein